MAIGIIAADIIRPATYKTFEIRELGAEPSVAIAFPLLARVIYMLIMGFAVRNLSVYDTQQPN